MDRKSFSVPDIHSLLEKQRQILVMVLTVVALSDLALMVFLVKATPLLKGDLFLGLSILIGIALPLVVVFFLKRSRDADQKILQQVIGKEVEVDDYCIRFAKLLGIGRVLFNKDNDPYYSIPWVEIVDWQTEDAGGKLPARFCISWKTSKGIQRLDIRRDPLRRIESELIPIIEQKINLPGFKVDSPEQVKERAARTKIAMILGVGMGLSSLVGVFLFLFYPPLYFLSTIGRLASASALFTVIAWYHLRNKSSLSSSSSPGLPSPRGLRGRGEQSILLLGLFFVLAILIYAGNVFFDFSQPLEAELLILDKYEQTHKRSKSQHVLVDALTPQAFDEKISIRIMKSEFDRINLENTKLKLLWKKGAFFIPWLKGYSILFPGPLAQDLRALEEARSFSAERVANTNVEKWEEVRWPNGHLKERIPMKNGRANGEASYWHPNGVLYAKIPFLDGKKHGRFQLFRDDGSLEQDLSYKDGMPHGECRWYHSDGRLDQKAIYVNGVPQK